MKGYKKHGHFDKQYKTGAKIGYKQGGQVKKMNPQPATEASGTPNLKPKYKHGGYKGLMKKYPKK